MLDPRVVYAINCIVNQNGILYILFSSVMIGRVSSGPYPADVPAETLHWYEVAGLKPSSTTSILLDW